MGTPQGSPAATMLVLQPEFAGGSGDFSSSLSWKCGVHGVATKGHEKSSEWGDFENAPMGKSDLLQELLRISSERKPRACQPRSASGTQCECSQHIRNLGIL
ncbi:high mobility group nucleosome-binding domain-containing protein 5 [Platysternon megacephalum]|uniref:High mobility group nucleosome-binding domain-containing protein 5 n=1 Tax=Platysternon megacephalum TaxID=55544 RepID=A0A4D9EDV9_9SAUR|nr:high mobility group nucleosome-binding domain-containing protein 5 [Platysternon megacephalum]